MKIWLVTTGSSDVQLTTNDHWNAWYEYSSVKRQCDRLAFKPALLERGKQSLYRIAPRVLGRVYQQQPDEVWEYLKFPLLQEFTAKLASETIDRIIVLLTDQTQKIEANDRRETFSPYWQDTSELQPIFDRYLKTHFPQANVDFLYLAPQSAAESGLDDWNAVLSLVRSVLAPLQEDISSDLEAVYVSHQAGTPAISSAVQFVSLACFRSNVQFLVSNEHHPDQTRLISQSAYLGELQRQEAKALLAQYNYEGVQKVLRLDKTLDDSGEKDSDGLNSVNVQPLLDAAIQWNCAKFEAFEAILQQQQILEIEPDAWCRLGYESAYLAWMRLIQGNLVDAMFHSFRAVEGTFSEWGKHEFQDHVELKNKRPFLKPTILEDEGNYFKNAKFKSDGSAKDKLAELKQKLEDLRAKNKSTILYGETLYTLFRTCHPQHEKECPDIKRFWDTTEGISEKRNKIFHQLEGLSLNELFEIWEVADLAAWEDKLLRYLNYITGQSFSSLAAGSRMHQIHQALLRSLN